MKEEFPTQIHAYMSISKREKKSDKHIILVYKIGGREKKA